MARGLCEQRWESQVTRSIALSLPIRVGLAAAMSGAAAGVLAGMAGGQGSGHWMPSFLAMVDERGVVTPSSSSLVWTSSLSPASFDRPEPTGTTSLREDWPGCDETP